MEEHQLRDRLWRLSLLALLTALTLSCGAESRIPATSSSPPQPRIALVVQEMASGLHFPSSFTFAPDGRVFYVERLEGAVRVLREWRLEESSFAQLQVARRSETGLLGLALHPGFPQVPYLYIFYTYQEELALYNRVSRLRQENGKGVEEKVLLDRLPAASFHNGGAIAFGPDGKLYVPIGDTTLRALAQDVTSPAGKVLRVNDDGTTPEDNPFPGSPVYTLGHRNIFGIAFHPLTGQPYITENGTTRDDEINLLEPGMNYGWPLHLGVAEAPGFTDPLLTFTPNIAPTQAVFYTGDQLPDQYRGNLFFGDWSTKSLHRLVLDDERQVLEHEVVLRSPDGGILDVEQGTDGHLYFSTASAIYRVEVGP